MTRVRGKEPIEVNHVKKVIANSYTMKISVHLEGVDGGGQLFTAVGHLEMYCAKNLVLDLRLAMRKVRNEAVDRLNKAVADADVPL